MVLSGHAVARHRVVLMTGKHPGHAIVRNNRAMRSLGEPEQRRCRRRSDDRRTAGSGGTSGAFGKWGLGNTGSTGNPTKQGFNRFFGYNCQSHAPAPPAILWSNNQK